ncbi:hypothetical protein BDV96DRAFT_653665 [Lophiotrema nucula]|uniref:Uncharacterized protein n=1 Tax=Lophiotrema nucula TaxID=690887 RepID=A0A6A5YKE6_9PLEO|nr:hypothetical protein BDV96DRAFT_653665 [Lophiotrema nucula]
MERTSEKQCGDASLDQKEHQKEHTPQDHRSHLEALPEDILERIPQYTHDELWTIGNLFNLRLTSRAIEAKTRHAFARFGFQSLTVDFNFQGLSQLQEIASHEYFGKTVQSLVIWRCEMSREHYEELEDEMSSAVDEEDRERVQNAMDRVSADTADRNKYLETSGAGAALLTKALSNLPNVIHIHMEPVDEDQPPVRYDPNGEGKGTTTILMTSVIAAVAASNTRLVKLTMPTFKSGIGYHQGVFPYALTLPQQLQSIFDNLQDVRLILKSGYEIDRMFLLRLPALKHLNLILDESEHGNSAHPVALTSLLSGKPCASQLETLSIEGANMNPNTEADFLRPHAATLRSLTLKTCNLRFVRLTRILDALKRFTALSELNLHQISENNKRVSFSTQGFLSTMDLPESRDFDIEGYVLIDPAQKYTTKVEGWEDMGVSLESIQYALDYTNNFYGSDTTGPGVEWWDVSDRVYNLPY